jgi:transposase
MASIEMRWSVGVDWGSEYHQVCVVDEVGQRLGERSVAHSGEGLETLCRWLCELTGGSAEQIAVAIETPHGAVVDTLLEQGFVVYAINPKQLDRFRDRFTVAGVKDDRLDAYVLGECLRTDRARFRRLSVAAPSLIELRQWSRMTEELRQERVRLTNRVREQLRRYYPQALELSDDVGAGWFLELWQRAPSPEKAKRLRRSSVERILKARRIRRLEAAEVQRVLRAPALRVAAGTTEAATAHIRALSERVKLVDRQLAQCERRLDMLCEQLTDVTEDDPTGQEREQRDVEILRSLPGVGRIVLATLLAEAWQPLRRRDYHSLRALAGVAPVTRRSGKYKLVVMRRACIERLREAVYHWARVAAQHDPLSRTRYAALRKRGHSHGRALRSVADRLLAVACTMLRDGTLYDPTHHLRQAA